MKKAAILLLIGMGILFSGCTEDIINSDDTMTPPELKSATKPAPNISGSTVLSFTPTPPNFWNGTIELGDAGEFKISSIAYGEGPRDYSMASPFEEDIYIYDLNASFPPDDDELYLLFHHTGTLSNAQGKFTASGKVISASGPLGGWMDCTTHSKGVIYYEEGLPYGAVTIRVN